MFNHPLDSRGIDIDTDEFHSGRKHARHRERMPNGRQQQCVRHVGKFFTHHFLSLNCVRRCAGNRALVANRSEEDDIDIVTDARVHDPASQDIFRDGCCNPASFTNGIDRAHEVLAPASCECKIEADTQRSAEQRPFHIVTGKGIAGEKPIDISSFNEAHQMLASAGSHDRRTGDNCDFALRLPGPSKFFRHFANDGGLIVSKLTCESQVNGGIIMGIGYALYEERVMDRHAGVVVNPNFETYKLTGLADVPEIEVILLDMPERGVIGIGEPVTIPTAAAVANAVANALGVRINSLPITPARVLEALGRVKPTAAPAPA